jgi:uncharacterized peroxidase-related enzyme
MSFEYPEFGNNDLTTIFESYPRRASLMIRLMADVMAESKELSVGDKELIFAFTSYQNACHFCFESHKVIAENHGLDQNTFEHILENLDGAAIEERLKAVLNFVKKLSNNPSRIVKSDVFSVINQGFSEEAVMDVISICALANYMNRFVDGFGVDITKEQTESLRQQEASSDNYDRLLIHLDRLQ